MKTRHFLIAALLLGGMTAFNACSDKDEIDNIVPPIDQPTEELDTYLALGAGFSDKLSTRAEDPSFNNKNLPSYEKIRNYAIAVFEVANGQPGALLSYYTKVNGNSAIWGENDENSATQDKYGFSLHPLKFKTSATQVAVVVVANCDQIYKEAEDLDNIKNFKEFTDYINTATLNLMKSFLGGSPSKFGGYPMSSNVCIFNIQPGLMNTVGYGDVEAGNQELAKALGAYEQEDKLSSGAYVNLSKKISTENRIYLYRCWSQVELTDIQVKTYSANATEAKFELQSAFLMNVPTKTKLFADDVTVTTGSSWKRWGGDLNFDLTEWLGNAGELGNFYSGYEKDKDAETKENSDKLPAGYTKGYRSKDFADNTVYHAYFTRTPQSSLQITSGNVVKLDNQIIPNNQLAMLDPDAANKHLFNYVVSACNYGLDGVKMIENQRTLLVVKGVYSEKIGNTWVTPNDAENEPRYYTIVVNENGTVDKDGYLSDNIENTIMRNVKYDISAVIAGPGSDTPVGYLSNTYVTPKVTIVPFGHVTQTSEID